MTQINEDLWNRARKLAARPYSVAVMRDRTTDDELIFVAVNPELSGCISQGETVEEAVKNLADARIDYIYFLIVDGLSVPDPSGIAQTIIVDLGSEALSRQHFQVGSWAKHKIISFPSTGP